MFWQAGSCDHPPPNQAEMRGCLQRDAGFMQMTSQICRLLISPPARHMILELDV